MYHESIFVEYNTGVKKQGNFLIKSHMLPTMSSLADLSALHSLLKDIVGGVSSTSVESKVQHFCQCYLDLHADGKYKILKHLAQNYNVEHSNVKQAAQSLLLTQEKGDALLMKSEERLRTTLTPRYSDLFSRIGRLEGGVKFLVDFRTDLLNLLSIVESEDCSIHYLKALNNDLKDLLALWFSVGFLTLERVTWDSSCDMLQKISEYEAVHPMRNWTDLKRRVGAYRRCYVFTHSSMPREPIVVLHTALTSEISSSIQVIVAHQRMHSEGDISHTIVSGYQSEDPKKIHAAIFYSITSTQKGLHGIELGNQLIKRVVREVQAEYPHIAQFSTLSPIPGFREWLLAEFRKIEKGESPMSLIFLNEEFRDLKAHICVGDYASSTPWVRLTKLIGNNSWIQDSHLTDMLHNPLMRACSHYLYKEKRRGYALNSVAHFHLRNGAVLWRLNWQADLSPRGLTNSCGIMVNYRYFLEATEENSQRYIEQFHVEVSDKVHQLLMSQHHHQSAL